MPADPTPAASVGGEGTTCELPGGVELLIAEYAIEVPGGRADDLLINLTAADGRHLGTLTLGWFRERTSVGVAEAELLNGGGDDDADE